MRISDTVGLAAAILVAAASARAGAPLNLISNGGFEEGVAGWNSDAGHQLAAEPAAPRSGKACLTGEVTRPKEALFLRRRVPVKQGNRYEFEVWARATDRTKAVLWVVQPGAAERQAVATFQNLTRRWNRYSTAVTVTGDGTLELILVAPSSHGAPAGRIWIDDLAFYETEMPPITPVSGKAGFDDEPAMAAAADGTVYVAYNSFRDGADSLRITRYRPKGDQLELLAGWRFPMGPEEYLLGPRVASAGENVAILYAAESRKRWNVYLVRCGPDGPNVPAAITSGGVNVKPAAAWHEGTLWVAWESNRNGRRQIFAASVRDGKTAEVSEPVALSRPDTSSYDPSVAVLDGGEVCVAWQGLVENSYDVYLRRKPAGGGWGPEIRLTRAPSIDRHGVLFSRGDELWLIYENAQTEKYNIGRTNRRRLIVAKVTPEGLLVPSHGRGDSPLAARCEAPAAAFDAEGRLWLALLKPRLPRAGWDLFLTGYSDGRWQPPTPVSTMKGMDRRPSLAIVGGRALVAFQADDMPNSWSDLDRTMEADSNVYLASVELGRLRSTGAMALDPLVESAEPFEPAQLHVLRGEDTPTPSIDYRGRKLDLYFGDLHEHTDVSVCNRVGDQSIDESYQHMRDVAHHDFACATDHGYNINPYLWSYTAKLARINDDPGRFLTFLAEEWTSTFEEYGEKHPYGFYGHRNLIFADPYFPRWFNARNRQTPAQIWEDLRKLNANFVQIPHQLADTGNVPTDWSFTDEQAQPVAEIFQTRGSYEHKGTPREAGRTTPPGYFLQDAWARGIVIGVIASPDHGGGYGKACVFAPELTREAILDALRARHCYGTTAAKVFLDVRVDGHLMGEKIEAPAGKSVEVKIAVRCPGEIARIEVCRNNRFIYTANPKGRNAELTFLDREPLAGRSYYYVRVVQQDEEIAWSSPVWFAAE